MRFIDPDGHQGDDPITRLLRWFARQLDPQTEAEQPRRGPLSLDADKVTAQATGETAKNIQTAGEWAETLGLDFGALNMAKQINAKNPSGVALAGVMVAVNVLTLGKGEGAVVIGESMENRVMPVALKLGADAYEGRALSRAGELLIAKNVSWVEKQIKNGSVVLDIGLDAARDARQRSPFYAAEVQTLLKHGYKRVEYGVVKVKDQTLKVYAWSR